jgi:hypothetical protein
VHLRDRLRSRTDVANFVAATLAPPPTGCTSDLGKLLVEHTNVLVAYAAMLERAATHKDVSLQAGALLTSAQKASFLKKSLGALPGFVTGDNIDVVMNGVVNLAANHARASALEDAVRQADGTVQRLAAEFAYYYGRTDVCDPETELRVQRPMQWCAIFAPERREIVTTYGALVASRSPYRSDYRPVDVPAMRRSFDSAIELARRTGDFRPAEAQYEGVLAQLRVRSPEPSDRIRALRSFSALQRTARAAASRHDASALSSLYADAVGALENADQLDAGALSDPLRTRLTADAGHVRDAVAAGSEFASAANAFAAEHAHIVVLINAPVPQDTAVFDR